MGRLSLVVCRPRPSTYVDGKSFNDNDTDTRPPDRLCVGASFSRGSFKLNNEREEKHECQR